MSIRNLFAGGLFTDMCTLEAAKQQFGSVLLTQSRPGSAKPRPFVLLPISRKQTPRLPFPVKDWVNDGQIVGSSVDPTNGHKSLVT